ncbi:hypothetical protein DsansV1_C12g0115451 [Dioscorea sansibarensis]
MIHYSPYFLPSHIHETFSFRGEDLVGSLLKDEIYISEQHHSKEGWTNYTFDFMIALIYAFRIIKSD